MKIKKINYPKISIVTPCYNSSKFIHRLHESLCRQDYKNFEWVLVDDCSIDDTVNVISKLSAPGQAGMQVYKLPQNSGGGVALGFAFEKCLGEIVIMVDHDDELFDSALSTVILEWDQIDGRSECVGLFYRRFDPEAGGVIGEKLTPGTEFTMSWQSNVKPSITDGVLVLKSNIARKYFNTRALESICLNGVPLNLMTKNYKLIAGSAEPFLIYHRDNPDSQTNNIKISRKTVYTYAKYIDSFDFYYVFRPIYWLRHIVAMIKFSILLFSNPFYQFRYIESKFINLLSCFLIPAAYIMSIYSKNISIINFPVYDFSKLQDIKNLVNEFED